MSTSSDVIRIVSANFEEGGLDPDRSSSRWEHHGRAHHMVSGRGVRAGDGGPPGPLRRRAHLWPTANALGTGAEETYCTAAGEAF
jgi:hypothetical protein